LGRTTRLGEVRRGERLLGVDTPGAKVEGVELGFSAFGLDVDEAAALGLKALGLRVSEAAALGFVEFGPDTVAADPGVGDETPPVNSACAAPVKATLAAIIRRARRVCSKRAMAPSRRVPNWVNVRRGSRLPEPSAPARIHASFSA
jgi:hypothetical protein